MVKQVMVTKILLAISSMTLLACNPLSPVSGNTTGKSKLSLNESNLPFGYGYVLKDDPMAVSGNKNLDYDSNISGYIYKPGVFITQNQYLQKTCSMSDGFYSSNISNCVQVQNDRNSNLITPKNGKWPYTFGTAEFLDVQAFYHLSTAIDKFHDNIAFSLNQSSGINNPSSLPSSLISDKAYWGKNTSTGISQTLNVFSNSTECLTNSYFDPARFEICFSYDESTPSFKFVYDPAVIYHELGHAFVDNMMNFRNRTTPISTLKTRFSGLGYTEAGAMNEGFADYFSYVITARTLFSQWALGVFGVPRPMSEDESIHAPGLDVTSDSRLSYPFYIDYASNAPEYSYKNCLNNNGQVECSEDVHMAGQITGHYLVALTKDIRSTCGFDHATATRHVIFALSESLSEIGDITKQGKNSTTNFGTFSNLVQGSFSGSNELLAYDWAQTVNPPNMRRFYQTFSRNIIKIMTDPLTYCPFYTKDQVEKLLDEYGLLLFKSYNDNGNDIIKGQNSSVPVTQVSTANRIKSVLISKSLIGLTTVTNESKAFVFDSRSDISAMLNSLSFAGLPVQLSSMIPSDLRYNNGNGNISPGEVFGLALNLQNKSNSTMAGIQVLANDWDHSEAYTSTNTKRKICKLSDGFPLESEGGSVENECSDAEHTNAAPICYIQLRGTNETRWISQEEYKQINGDFPCLDEADPKNCVLRVIPQKNTAFFSKLDPGLNWGKSIINGVPGATGKYSSGNIILFEANKWISPGTTFNCRFRVRFSNCSDCYHDPAQANIDNDDYKDVEYAGEKPFRLINLQFNVSN